MNEFNRSRSRNTLVPSSCEYRERHLAWSQAKGWYTDYDRTSSRGSGVSGTTESTSDYVTPNFQKIRKSGGVVMSALDHVTTERSWTPGSVHIIWPLNYWSGEVWYSGDTASMFNAAAPVADFPIFGDVERMKSVVLTSAFSRIDDADILSGETLGDMSKTIGMLRRPFAGAQDLLRRMTKSRSRIMAKSSKAIAQASANTWLEYRYGWKPVLMDCETIIQQTHKFRERLNVARRVSRAGDSVSSVRTNTSPSPVLVNSMLTTATRTDIGSLRVSAGVMYAVKQRTKTEQLMKVLGLRPSDIPATAWEKIPYSFVVDWFVNVGDWIRAVTPNPDVNILDSWLTIVTEKKQNVSYQWSYYAASSPPTSASGSGGSETFKEVSVRRHVHLSPPSTPVFKGNMLSLTHSLDAAALLVGSLTSNLKKW